MAKWPVKMYFPTAKGLRNISLGEYRYECAEIIMSLIRDSDRIGLTHDELVSEVRTTYPRLSKADVEKSISYMVKKGAIELLGG